MSFFAKKVRVCRWSLLAASVTLVPIFGSMNSARAASSISDGNSTLTFNPAGGSLPFVSNWVVDGVDQYGGSPAGGDNLQYSDGGPLTAVNSLSVSGAFFSSGIASVTYEQDEFSINVKEILTGGSAGSGASAINEIITVTNTRLPGDQSPPLQFEIADHVDLNVNGTPNNDTLTLSPSTPNTAEQTDPTGAAVNFTSTPTPDSFDLINGGSSSVTLGPSTGNVGFDFIWDLSIANGSSAQISINETLTGGTTSAVPLPNSACSALFTLAGLGGIGIVRRMRRAV